MEALCFFLPFNALESESKSNHFFLGFWAKKLKLKNLVSKGDVIKLKIEIKIVLIDTKNKQV